ncbi:P-loop containing nucleoside triphosphate hydrolase protein [Halteromyces radiatus]|uniref:P-loop containing nucleoside triphosphate hydrolase protein n=1 Tax=Halteromyces radiatus TaxID=101107 RepID=UPI00222044C0|nr:P-loop containing nucleoside triphosphate hydrolase protein [Halteromyces radiatus]KAI8081621.1 P-loop containing nucleoside triphosphate hydrolase protein [Halteromyces radiatus]
MFCIESSGGSISNPIRRKLVIVGDGGVGKTCLLCCYANDDFAGHSEHIPTIFDSYVKDIKCQNKYVELTLWDTAGQEEFNRLRTLSYPDADVILIAFSVDSPESLENVTELWIPEVNKYCRGLPFLLVGCKSDLRTDEKILNSLAKENQKPVTYKQGFELATRLGTTYLETSAKTGTGIEAVFLSAVQATLNKKSSCVIL